MVEIIPKKDSPFPQAINKSKILFFLGLFLLLVVAGVYFLLGHLVKNASLELAKLDEELAGKRTEQYLQLKARITEYHQKLEDFSNILAGFQYSNNFFDFLENKTHPQVWLTSISLQPNEFWAEISGQAPSFQIVGEQVLAFEKSEFVQKVDLTSIEMGEIEVNFNINLLLDPQLFLLEIPTEQVGPGPEPELGPELELEPEVEPELEENQDDI